MQVFIMRGLPGSGKSTWIKKTLDPTQTVICSADDYHTEDGIYKYNPANAGRAHGYCLEKFIKDLQGRQYPWIVVDNTNSTLLEIAPYARIAEAYQIELEIITLPCDIQTAIKRNTHAVPASTILAMQANILTQPIPLYWKHSVYLQEDQV